MRILDLWFSLPVYHPSDVWLHFNINIFNIWNILQHMINGGARSGLDFVCRTAHAWIHECRPMNHRRNDTTGKFHNLDRQSLVLLRGLRGVNTLIQLGTAWSQSPLWVCMARWYWVVRLLTAVIDRCGQLYISLQILTLFDCRRGGHHQWEG